MMRAGFRLLRTQAFRPPERKQAELSRIEYGAMLQRRLRDQVKITMRSA
jgi:hypothetical protein